jgi:hypothetical protein
MRTSFLCCLLFYSCGSIFAQSGRSLQDDLRALDFSWGLSPELSVVMDEGIHLLRKKEVKAACKKFEYVLNADTTCFSAWFCLKMYEQQPAYAPVLNTFELFSFSIAYKQLWDLLVYGEQIIDPTDPTFQLSSELKNMIAYQAR